MKEIRYNLKTFYDDEIVIVKAITLEELFQELEKYTKFKAEKCELFRYEIEKIEVI